MFGRYSKDNKRIEEANKWDTMMIQNMEEGNKKREVK